MKTEELRELLELAEKDNHYLRDSSVGILRDDALINAADLIRCRELLADVYSAYCSQMSSEYDYPGRPWTPERDCDMLAIAARRYLNETE